MTFVSKPHDAGLPALRYCA